MKKIFIITVFLLSLPLLAVSQQTTNGRDVPDKDTIKRQSVLRVGEKDRIIPVSREQAEVLVTEMVSAMLEADSLEKKRDMDELVMRTKLEVLKRKLIDEALARRYNAGLEARLDRLERILMLQVASNTNVPPEVLQSIFLLQPIGSSTGQSVSPVLISPASPTIVPDSIQQASDAEKSSPAKKKK